MVRRRDCAIRITYSRGSACVRFVIWLARCERKFCVISECREAGVLFWTFLWFIRVSRQREKKIRLGEGDG